MSGDLLVRARAVELILEGRVEEALELLSKHYGVRPPRVKVGLPKKHARSLACYDPSRRLICLRSSEELRNPLVVLHEYYHHLRFTMGKHRGTEKHADKYALESYRAYLALHGEGRVKTGGD